MLLLLIAYNYCGYNFLAWLRYFYSTPRQKTKPPKRERAALPEPLRASNDSSC